MNRLRTKVMLKVVINYLSAALIHRFLSYTYIVEYIDALAQRPTMLSDDEII